MRVSIAPLRILLAGAFLLVVTDARASTIYGDALSCSTSASVFPCNPSASAIAGPGVEFSILSFSVDFGMNDVRITAIGNASTPGLDLLFTDVSSPFRSENIISNTFNGIVPGLPPTILGPAAIQVMLLTGTGSLFVGFAPDAIFASGQSIDIGLTTAASSAAPEPSSLFLISGSVVAAGFWLRLRKMPGGCGVPKPGAGVFSA